MDTTVSSTACEAGTLPLQSSHRHPENSPVFLRYHVSPAIGKHCILHVQIARLIKGPQYVALVQLSRGSVVVFEHARKVSVSNDENFCMQYAVELSEGDVHSLCLKVYDTTPGQSDSMPSISILLAAATRDIMMSKQIVHQVVGGKRRREPEEVQTPQTTKKPVNRQADILKFIVQHPVTEREILEQCGDNRYTREILRRLVSLGTVERLGKGGASDPFRYRFLRTLEEALEQGGVDPTVHVRMQRIERKITLFLSQHEGFVSEKEIRATVGDNTGTGKALRNMVKTSRVTRIGKGGVADPFRYKASQDEVERARSGGFVSSDSNASSCSSPSSSARASSSSNSDASDTDDAHPDVESEAMHALALLATGHSGVHSSVLSSASEFPRKSCTTIDMYLAAAAALDGAYPSESKLI
jgi:hypothetical protein